jgi:tetratricopeptide (TPR) repeat protein
MTQADVQQVLAAGIDAIKRGQKARGRDLLMQVVEADEHNEQAWLWLSAAVDAPEDQITALENVLEINPNNQVAHKGLERLRARLDGEAGAQAPGAAPEAVPETGLQAYAVASPIESVSALDDPYQCVYCGAAAAPELRRCPECGRTLMVQQGSDRITPSVSSAVFVMLLCIAVAGIETIALAIFHFQGRGSFVRFLFDTWGFEHLFGYYPAWPGDLAQRVFWMQLGWLVTLLAVMLAFLYQVKAAYAASVGAMGLNLLWVVYRWVNGFIGPALGVFDILASLAALFFIFAAQPDFRVNLTRLRCAADPRIKGGEALHKLGLIYKKQGQWGLAVAHWRAALAAMPTQPDFYKDLAIGYAQLGYYERSLRTLSEFNRLRPDDSETTALKTVIEQKRSADPRPRG